MPQAISEPYLNEHSIALSTPHENVSWQILHQLPGRVRVRVPELAAHARYGAWLQSALNALPGVTSVRVNQAARSVVIKHQPAAAAEVQAKLAEVQAKLVGPSAWAQATSPEGEGSTPKRLLRVSDDVQLSIAESTGNWERLRLPALASGLAFASQFPPLQIVRPLAIATLAMAILPIAQRAFQSIWQKRRLNIDCLDLLAVSLTAWQGKLLTPALVITLHELGDAIREQTAPRYRGAFVYPGGCDWPLCLGAGCGGRTAAGPQRSGCRWVMWWWCIPGSKFQ